MKKGPSGPLTKATDRFGATAIDDQIVVMSLENGDFFSLTGTVRAIRELIDGTHSRDAGISVLASRFGRAEVEIASDDDAFRSKGTDSAAFPARWLTRSRCQRLCRDAPADRAALCRTDCASG